MKYMVHHYDALTGEYLRSGYDAHENPRRPGEPLIPRNATTKAPPQAEKREKAVYRGAGWHIVPDWRGEKFYKKADGAEVSYKLGEEPDCDDVTEIPRPTQNHVWNDENGGWEIPLERLKELKLAEIEDKRWEAEIGGISLGDFRVHTDRESQAKYTGAVTRYRELKRLPPAWKCLNGWYPINSIDDLLALSAAVSDHVDEVYTREARLQLEIASAETREAVEAISWDPPKPKKRGRPKKQDEAVE